MTISFVATTSLIEPKHQFDAHLVRKSSIKTLRQPFDSTDWATNAIIFFSGQMSPIIITQLLLQICYEAQIIVRNNTSVIQSAAYAFKCITWQKRYKNYKFPFEYFQRCFSIKPRPSTTRTTVSRQPKSCCEQNNWYIYKLNAWMEYYFLFSLELYFPIHLKGGFRCLIFLSDLLKKFCYCKIYAISLDFELHPLNACTVESIMTNLLFEKVTE